LSRLQLLLAPLQLAGALATTAVVSVRAPHHPLPLEIAVGAGLLAAVALFRSLAGCWPSRPQRRSGRAVAFAGAALLLAITASAEELVWRRLVFGAAAPITGTLGAFALSTLGFALAHGASGPRGVVTHAYSGACFALLYLAAGSVVPPIVAHASYNCLVLAGAESERCLPAPLPP
jgi:membrane protease YdiL (CAAX protease family)